MYVIRVNRQLGLDQRLLTFFKQETGNVAVRHRFLSHNGCHLMGASQNKRY